MHLPIPPMGLGTYGRTGPEGLKAILAGLEIGYRHLDTAQSYGTEEVVGEAMRRCGIERSEIFVTTKVATGNLGRETFLPSLRKSRDVLGVEQIDLTLIHWPSPGDVVPFESYVEDLAKARQEGLTRLIGVSNFTIAHLKRAQDILGPGQISNNQVEIHPFLQNRKLVDYCQSMGIVPTAYVPLAKGKVADDPVLQRIGEKRGAAASQVALAWLLQRDIVVIPASANRDRLLSNFKAADLTLTQADMDEIAGLDRAERIIAPADGPDWD